MPDLPYVRFFKTQVRSIQSNKSLLVVIFMGIGFLFYLRFYNFQQGALVLSNEVVFHHRTDNTTNGTKATNEKIIGRRKNTEGLKTYLLEKQQKRRLERIQYVCQHYKIDGTVKELYSYSKRNVSYCSNHKAASTYWIQMFRFLHNDTPPLTKRPSDIPKCYTHLVPFRQTKKRNFLSTKDRQETMHNYRFMMTRDPYQRLWSVFIDKFVMLDHFFWNNYLSDIRINFLREFGGFTDPILPSNLANVFESEQQNFSINIDNQMRRLREKALFKPPVSLCKKLSFEEFVFYVVSTGKASLKAMNDHFQPIHVGCNPCSFKPNFIGKVETLNAEKGFLLEKLGLSRHIDGVVCFNDYVRYEIRILSQFQFDTFRAHPYSLPSCITMKKVQERIIAAFVLNGYLPIDSIDRMNPIVPMKEDHFVEKLIEIFNISNRTQANVHLQRENMRKNAYAKIPLQSLLALQKVYTYDFLLFGYEPQPSYIFKDRVDFDINSLKMIEK